ncbi:MAG: citrate lyase beta subunit [Deltaproteobacteria bacterium]|nr:MAG: citrate lyase beta subunit [Deltaproteobacteria bacterium]
MNAYERKMVSILRDLRESYHVVGVKAEFEAEGTRLEEAMRLKEVLMEAGLGLTLKIGGCEALRDIYEARLLGVKRLVAPMVETPYALKKFLAAFRLGLPPEERQEVVAAINVETISTVEHLDELLAVDTDHILNGIVFGRVDLCGSMGLSREEINSEKVSQIAARVFAKAKKRGLVCAIGGGVSADSLPIFRDLPPGHLDYYETRKVIFACPGALGNQAQKGILMAVEFELLWLKNKRDFHGMIFAEDESRIEMLESRYRKAMQAMGVGS